jgi:adenylate cyclase class 2
MKIEIESKISVESFDSVISGLKESGATFREKVLQRDTFFVDKEKNLIATDRGLRLRRQICDGGEKVILTYKGKRQKKGFKSRREIEVEVNSFESMEEMFLALGLEKSIAFEKKRDYWFLDECEICLDELPMLGKFVEVEGPDEAAIRRVLEMIGLSASDHVDESYSRMMSAKLDEFGVEASEAMFENSKDSKAKS